MNTFLRSIIIFFLQLARPAAALLPSLPRQNSHQQNRRAWTTWTNPRALPSENAIEEGVRDEEEAARLRRELAQTREAVLLLEQKLAETQVLQQRSRLNPRYPTVDYNYGFLSRSVGVYIDNTNAAGDMGPPLGLLPLALRNFKREAEEILRQLAGVPTATLRRPRDAVIVDPDFYLKGSFDGSPEGLDLARDDDGSDASCDALRQELDALTLSNEAVHSREKTREASGGGVAAPVILRLPYELLCGLIDLLFEDRPLARFWFLETVARMPYFSYISMLHLYESLGWWRRSAEIKRVHFAEEWNEFHHLLIMESLGGDQRWSDRFWAQHSAVAYYWVLIGLWLFSPSVAYNFSELIEAHAVDTYEEFVEANSERLKTLPAPAIAVQYYMNGDMFLFDEFQSNRPRGSRRPVVTTLFDVFSNIAADEAEHVSTMQSCQDPESIVQSPNNERLVASVAASLAAVGYLTTRAGSGGELAATYGGAEAGLLEELLGAGGESAAAILSDFASEVFSTVAGLAEVLDGADLSSVTEVLSNLLPWLDDGIISAISAVLKELLNFI